MAIATILALVACGNDGERTAVVSSTSTATDPPYRDFAPEADFSGVIPEAGVPVPTYEVQVFALPDEAQVEVWTVWTPVDEARVLTFDTSNLDDDLWFVSPTWSVRSWFGAMTVTVLDVDLDRTDEICRRDGDARLDVFGSVIRADDRRVANTGPFYGLASGARLGWDVESLSDELSEILGWPADLVSVGGFTSSSGTPC